MAKAKRPAAKWVGTLTAQQLNLSLGIKLFSNKLSSRIKLPFMRVHASCRTQVKVEASAATALMEPAKDETPPAEKEAGPTQVAVALRCPSCNKGLQPDEVVRAVDTQIGILTVTDEEFDTIKPKKSKCATGTVVSDALDMLMTVCP